VTLLCWNHSIYYSLVNNWNHSVIIIKINMVHLLFPKDWRVFDFFFSVRMGCWILWLLRNFIICSNVTELFDIDNYYAFYE